MSISRRTFSGSALAVAFASAFLKDDALARSSSDVSSADARTMPMISGTASSTA